MRKKRKCKHPGCDRDHNAKGYCGMHYSRWRAGKDMDAPPIKRRKKPEKHCVYYPECDRDYYRDGLCRTHFRRLQKGTDLDAPVRVKDGRHKNNNGYIHVMIAPGVRKLEHRLVMELYLDRELLPGEEVHHKNGIRDDNRLENLELWSTSQPAGQRIEDKLKWAYEIIELYEGKIAA